MALVFQDRVDTLSVIERNGVIRSLVRKARVLFTAGESPYDFTVLKQALNLCPAPYTTLAALGYDSLVLVERNAEVVDNEPDCIDVLLKYEHLLDGPNQGLINPPTGRIYGKGRCSIVEKTTNFFYPFGDPKRGRTQILTAHTFPEWDIGIVGQPLNPDLPMTVLQGGEVSIPFPQANFTVQGVIFTYAPMAIAMLFVGAINNALWMNGDAGTWICSEVQWDVLDTRLVDNDPTKILYRFQFEFQYNIDTWNPVVVFNDQRTGRPPADVELPTLADENGIFRLTINPYSLAAAGLAAGQNAVQQAQIAGINAANQVVDAAWNAIIVAFTNGQTVPEAEAAALAAAQKKHDDIVTASSQPFANQNLQLAIATIRDVAQMFAVGLQAGTGAGNTEVAKAAKDLNTNFPPGVLFPVGGGQAINEIAAGLVQLAADAAGAAGALAGHTIVAQQDQIKLQPAGIWQVPALRPVNFDTLFGSYFEGLSAKVF